MRMISHDISSYFSFLLGGSHRGHLVEVLLPVLTSVARILCREVSPKEAVGSVSRLTVQGVNVI